MVKISKELKEIFNILSMTVESESDLFSVLVPRDLLLRVDIEQRLTELISNLKGKYKTSKLNCLHKNRESKQKFPGINLVRQILRCNGYHLKPVIYCRGYCKHSGKKIIDRNFKVVRINNYTEIKKASLKNEDIDVSGLGIFEFSNSLTNNAEDEDSHENLLETETDKVIETIPNFTNIQNKVNQELDNSHDQLNNCSKLVELNF